MSFMKLSLRGSDSPQSEDSIGLVTGGGGGGAVGFTICPTLPDGWETLGFGELLPGLGGTWGFGLPKVPVPTIGVPTACLAGTAGLSGVAGTGG